MSVSVTLLYGALLGIVGLTLQVLVIMRRDHHKMSIETAGKPDLLEAVRRHGNWAENVPFLLVMMAMLELSGLPKMWLHGLGALLLVSRILHPLGLAYAKATPMRIAGMSGTLFTTVTVLLLALWQTLLR